MKQAAPKIAGGGAGRGSHSAGVPKNAGVDNPFLKDVSGVTWDDVAGDCGCGVGD